LLNRANSAVSHTHTSQKAPSGRTFFSSLCPDRNFRRLLASCDGCSTVARFNTARYSLQPRGNTLQPFAGIGWPLQPVGDPSRHSYLVSNEKNFVHFIFNTSSLSPFCSKYRRSVPILIPMDKTLTRDFRESIGSGEAVYPYCRTYSRPIDRVLYTLYCATRRYCILALSFPFSFSERRAR
jgi:hypothetical protein